MKPVSMFLLAIISAAFIFISLKDRRKNALIDKLPHMGLPFIGIAWDWYRNGDLLNVAEKMCSQYNGICLLKIFTERVVVVYKHEYLKAFYTSRNVDKADFYAPVAEVVGHLTATSANGPDWKPSRKILNNYFFNVTPEALLEVFRKYSSQKLVAGFAKHADGDYFQAIKYIHESTCFSLFDRAFDSVPSEYYLTNVLDHMTYLLKMIVHRGSTALYYFKWIFQLTAEGRTFSYRTEDTRRATRIVIEDKMKLFLEMKEKGQQVPSDIYLYNLMEHFPEKNKEDLIDEVIHMVVASVDTTSEAIGFVLTMLGIHQDVQQKLFEEEQTRLRLANGAEPTVQDLTRHDYFDAVIKESLRMFAIAPIIGRKLIEDTYFGEYLLPAGTNVMCFQKLSNLDPGAFDNPRSFNPDRFLPENAKSIPSYAYNPFSNGPRSCPGMKYANLSLRTHIMAVVRNFKIYSLYKNDEEALANCMMEFTSTDKNLHTLRLETRTND